MKPKEWVLCDYGTIEIWTECIVRTRKTLPPYVTARTKDGKSVRVNVRKGVTPMELPNLPRGTKSSDYWIAEGLK